MPLPCADAETLTELRAMPISMLASDDWPNLQVPETFIWNPCNLLPLTSSSDADREEFDRPSKIALLPALPVQTERAHLHTQTTRTVAAASQHSKELNHSGHFRSEAERKPAQEPDRPARVVDACSIA